MKTEIRLTGHKNLMSWLSKHGEDTKNDVKKMIFRTGNDIRTEAMRNLERNGTSKTRKLKQSIQHITVKSGYGGEVFSGLDTSEFIEYGTKPHWIKIKHKKVLANVKTDEIFGKKVFHPGTKPKPFMAPAAHKHLTKLTNDLLALMRER